MLETVCHDDVLELRLARPPVNALDPRLVAALTGALRQAPSQGARAVVLSGSPGIFSAGLDVPALLALDRQGMRKAWRELIELLHTVAVSPLPIVAGITGSSPAGGALLALFCDHRIMAAGAFRIGLNEVEVGIPVPPVIHAALARQVGARHAEALLVAGRMLAPEEALAVGLVDELAPPAEVVPRALAWCGRLLALPPRAVEATRQVARADLVALFDEDQERAADRLVASWFTDETQRTLRALVARLRAGNGDPSAAGR